MTTETRHDEVPPGACAARELAAGCVSGLSSPREMAVKLATGLPDSMA